MTMENTNSSLTTNKEWVAKDIGLLSYDSVLST